MSFTLALVALSPYLPYIVMSIMSVVFGYLHVKNGVNIAKTTAVVVDNSMKIALAHGNLVDQLPQMLRDAQAMGAAIAGAQPSVVQEVSKR